MLAKACCCCFACACPLLIPPPLLVRQVWLPGDEMEDGETLQYDPSVYDCLSSLMLDWPSLSFDLLRDHLGAPRAAFPHTLFMVAGTQVGAVRRWRGDHLLARGWIHTWACLRGAQAGADELDRTAGPNASWPARAEVRQSAVACGKCGAGLPRACRRPASASVEQGRQRPKVLGRHVLPLLASAQIGTPHDLGFHHQCCHACRPAAPSRTTWRS